MHFPTQRARLNRVVVRGAVRDDPRSRRGLAAALLQVDYAVPGLGPRAMLVVRRMRDPLPRRLHGRAGVAPEWQAAMRGELVRIAGRAARPMRGRVPPDASAVLFSDEIECFACLLRLRGGELPWWARAVLPTLGLGSCAVEEILQREPRFVPALLAEVGRAGEPSDADALVAALSVATVRALFDRIAIEHGVVGLTAASIESLLDGPGAAVSPERDTQARAARGSDGAHRSRAETPRAPTADHAILIHLARQLAADPVPAHRASFHQELVRSWRLAEARTGDVGRTQVEDRVHPRSGAGVRRAAERSERTSGDPAFVDVIGASGSHAAATPRGAEPREAEPPSGDRDMAAGRSTHGRDRPESTRSIEAAGSVTPERFAERAHRTPSVPRSGLDRPTAFEVTTDLCGVFYTIEALRRIGLLGRVQAAGDEPSFGWPHVELIARCLVNDVGLAADPIWEMFAVLAGRSTASPVPTLSGAAACVPSRTLAAAGFAKGRLSWCRLEDAVEIRHPRGFPVCIETTSEAAVIGEARALLARYGASASPEVEAPPRDRMPLLPGHVDTRRWAACFAGVVRAWIEDRIGSVTPPVALEQLLRVRGVVRATTTHVDVSMPIDSICLAARLHGLDRDPGWVPQLARVVAFHFLGGQGARS